MKVYKIANYGFSIEEKEITKKSEKSIFYLRNGKVEQERIETNYSKWFDTKEEAITHKLKSLEKDIVSARISLQSRIDKLEEAKIKLLNK